MTEFSTQEASVLDYIQKSVPLVERPFSAIGADTGLRESDVCETILHLKEKGIIRSIAAIFSGESLGYHVTLAALQVGGDDIERASSFINSHPGVSHNYQRGHRYNIWFTLAVEKGQPLDDTVALIAKKTRAVDYLILRNERLLKLGVMLPIGSGHGGKNKAVARENPQRDLKGGDFTDEETEAVRLLQNDLPITERPFRALLKSGSGLLSEERLLKIASLFREQGIIRRYAAVLHHVKAGYTHNAMTVWKLPVIGDFEEKARIFIEEGAITHLYLRTVYPGKWEYPLFAMIHAGSGTELNKIIKRLSSESGLKDYLVLPTMREFKKRRVTYFSAEFKDWRDKHND